MVVPLGQQATRRLLQKTREGREETVPCVSCTPAIHGDRASAEWPRTACHRVESCPNAGAVRADDAILRDLVKCPGQRKAYPVTQAWDTLGPCQSREVLESRWSNCRALSDPPRAPCPESSLRLNWTPRTSYPARSLELLRPVACQRDPTRPRCMGTPNLLFPARVPPSNPPNLRRYPWPLNSHPCPGREMPSPPTSRRKRSISTTESTIRPT